MSIWLQYNRRKPAARVRTTARRSWQFGGFTTRLAFYAALQKLRRHRLAESVPKDDPTAKLKADIFYPIIARAITQLPGNEREARQNVYDRASEMLTSKLRGQDPSLIAHELRALELAIRRVEAHANVREVMSQKHRYADPPSYQCAADQLVPAVPQKQIPLG